MSQADDDYEYVTSRWSMVAVRFRCWTAPSREGWANSVTTKVVNACADSVLGTSIAETVYLTGTVLEDRLANALSWTPFEGWDVPRDRQVLMRGIQFGGGRRNRGFRGVRLLPR